MQRAAEDKGSTLGIEMADEDKVLFMLALRRDNGMNVLALAPGYHPAIQIIVETQLLEL